MTNVSTATREALRPPGYLALLRLPDALSFALPGVIGRFALATRSLTAALMVQEVTGSYGNAGLVGGWITLVAALAAPRLTHLGLRYGMRRLLIGTVTTHVLAGLALILAAYQDAPLVVLLLFATLIGLSSVSFGAISRAAWTRVVERGPALDRAFAFEAICEDVAFIVAPSTAIPLTLAIHPAAGLTASLIFTVIASVILVKVPDYLLRGTTAAPERASGTRRQPIMFVPGLRVLLLSLLCFGMVFGAIELSLVAFARELDREPLATVLLALIAIGSCTGGVVYGAIRWRIPPLTRLLRLGGMFAIGLLPVIFATEVWMMGIAVLLMGLFISPAIIATMTLNERVTPPWLMTESFAWIGSSISVGAAIGIFVGGWLIDEFGADGAQLYVAACGITSWLIVLLSRRELAPADAVEPA